MLPSFLPASARILSSRSNRVSWSFTATSGLRSLNNIRSSSLICVCAFVITSLAPFVDFTFTSLRLLLFASATFFKRFANAVAARLCSVFSKGCAFKPSTVAVPVLIVPPAPMPAIVASLKRSNISLSLNSLPPIASAPITTPSCRPSVTPSVAIAATTFLGNCARPLAVSIELIFLTPIAPTTSGVIPLNNKPKPRFSRAAITRPPPVANFTRFSGSRPSISFSEVLTSPAPKNGVIVPPVARAAAIPSALSAAFCRPKYIADPGPFILSDVRDL